MENVPDKLISAYLEGGLDETQAAELSQWVQASRDHARYLALLASLEHGLIKHAKMRSNSDILTELQQIEDRGEELDPMVLAAERFPAPESNSPTRHQYASALSYVIEHAFTHKRIAILATAAVLLLGAVLTIVLLVGDENTPGTAQVPDLPDVTSPTPDPNRVVAMVTDQVNAQWVIANGQGALPDRMLLATNQRLTLVAGFAEITTNRGARVLVQAPATIETTESDNAIRLHRGKLVGRCDTEHSKGLVVHAPGIDLVDLGTEFGVSADQVNGSTVLVMSGSVRAEPADTSPRAFEPVVLEQGDARRIEPETGELEAIDLSEVSVFYAQVPHPYVKMVNDIGSTLWLRQNQEDIGDRFGKAAYSKAGQSFGVLELDGQGCVDLFDALDFSSDQAFSVAVWIKPDMQSDDMFVLGRIAKHQERGIHGYDLYIKEQRLRFQMKHAFLSRTQKDSLIRIESPEKLNNQAWQHAVVTYDGSGRAAGVRMYLNGFEVENRVIDDSLSGNTIHADTTFRLGARGFVDAEHLHKLAPAHKLAAADRGSPMFGGIGDLVVFDRVIDREDIQSMHRLSRDAYFALNEGS
ncbi:MAG: LamG-like jellyroll fold domain-containing protein [Planctomycetota bacterium]